MSYIPTTGSSAFVSPTTREFHVGDTPNAYPTIQAAINAINALGVPPSINNRCAIVIHNGLWDETANGSHTIPSYCSVQGINKETTVLFNSAADLFIAGGDSCFFRNFMVRGANNAAISAINGNNQPRLHVRDVDLLNRGTQKFVTQIGATWITCFMEHCVIDAGNTSDYTCVFQNTSGAARYCDTEINDVFCDNYLLTATGGSFHLSDVQDFRFKDCKIRGVPAFQRGIFLERTSSGTAWMEIHSTTFRKLDETPTGLSFYATTNTDVLLSDSDAPNYTALGSITIVGGSVPGPAGPVGPVGPVGAAGPSTGLTTAYSVDLSTLPAQDLMPGGDATKTIDGRAAWILVQSANATSVYLNDGTHSGLYLRNNAANTDDFNTTYNGPRLVVPLTDLSGVKIQDAIEQWVWVMFSQPHTPNAGFEFSRLGIQQWPANADTGGTYKRLMLSLGFTTALTKGMEWHAAGVTTTAPAGTVLQLVTDDVYVFRIFAAGVVEAYAGVSVGGAFPGISTLRYVGSASFRSAIPGFDTLSINGSHSDTFQWAFTCNIASGNTAGNSDLLLSKLKIEYR